MKLNRHIQGVLSVCLYKNNIYLGTEEGLFQYSGEEKILIQQGRCKTQLICFDLLFFQDHQKDLRVFDGNKIIKFFPGRFSLHAGLISENSLILFQFNDKGPVLSLIDKDLNLRTGLNEMFVKGFINNVFLVSENKTNLVAYDAEFFQKLWSLDVSGLGSYYSPTRKPILNELGAQRFVTFKNQALLTLKGGQILAIDPLTGNINWMTETAYHKEKNGINNSILHGNSLYGTTGYSILEINAQNGQISKNIGLENINKIGFFPSQIGVFDPFLVVYAPDGQIALFEKDTFDFLAATTEPVTIPNQAGQAFIHQNYFYLLIWGGLLVYEIFEPAFYKNKL